MKGHDLFRNTLIHVWDLWEVKIGYMRRVEANLNDRYN